MRNRLFLVTIGIALGLTSQSCQRKAKPQVRGERFVDEGPAEEISAAWYSVPEHSLAKRRADGAEFTAANNHLPIGTLVRVTHLAHDRSVIVRITDRGITDPKIKLDLCKEAAEKLGMVSEGVAQVKMQVLRAKPAERSSPND